MSSNASKRSKMSPVEIEPGPMVGEDDMDSASPQQQLLIKGAWTKEEDKRLLDGIDQFGTEDWNQVRQVVGTRTSKQCRDRFRLKLDPNIVTAPWTRQEDEELMRLSHEHGRSWTKIAKQLVGRTENAVKARIATLERKRQGEWSQEDDALLRELKQRAAMGESIAFIQYFPNRTEHSIQKRWDALNGEEIAAKVRMSLLGGGNGKLEETAAASWQNPQPVSPVPTTSTPPPPLPPPSLPQQPQERRVPSTLLFQPLAEMPPPRAVPQVPVLPNAHFRSTGPRSPAIPKYEHVVPQTEAGEDGISSEGSRLKRHSTSMTVLMQVLSGAQAAAVAAAAPPSQPPPTLPSQQQPPTTTLGTSSPTSSLSFPRRMHSSSSMNGFLLSPPLSTPGMKSMLSKYPSNMSIGTLVNGGESAGSARTTTLPLTFSSTEMYPLQLPRFQSSQLLEHTSPAAAVATAAITTAAAIDPQYHHPLAGGGIETPGQILLNSFYDDAEAEKRQKQGE